MRDPVIHTPRLCLRPWREEDREPFAAMNADPAVMEFFPECWSREKSDMSFNRIRKHWNDHGFGPWVLEIDGRFAGMAGLWHVPFAASFTPAVEIGYRLRPQWWGLGITTEAGEAALGYGFEQLGIEEVVAYTVPGNARSRRVMEKLGMRYAQDFDHPELGQNHPMRRHVLYRLARVGHLKYRS
jgi:RimJ/RimL family protein N-acetyltransferase